MSRVYRGAIFHAGDSVWVRVRLPYAARDSLTPGKVTRTIYGGRIVLVQFAGQESAIRVHASCVSGCKPVYGPADSAERSPE